MVQFFEGNDAIYFGAPYFSNANIWREDSSRWYRHFSHCKSICRILYLYSANAIVLFWTKGGEHLWMLIFQVFFVSSWTIRKQVNWKCWTTCKSFVTRNSIVSAMWGANIPFVLDVLVLGGIVKAWNPSPSLSHSYHHVYLFTNQFSLNEVGLNILNFQHHKHSQNAGNSLLLYLKKKGGWTHNTKLLDAHHPLGSS